MKAKQFCDKCNTLYDTEVHLSEDDFLIRAIEKAQELAPEGATIGEIISLAQTIYNGKLADRRTSAIQRGRIEIEEWKLKKKQWPYNK